jgi:hypothetical protein
LSSLVSLSWFLSPSSLPLPCIQPNLTP